MVTAQQKSYSVGIIGGGKVGLDLLRLFSRSHHSKVAYVVDRDNQALAIIEAKKGHIPTFDSIERAILSDSDLIIEVTGSDRVVESLREKLDGAFGKLITHQMAFVLLQVIEENNHRVKESVINETGEIQTAIEINLNETEKMIDQIDKVTSEMRILALNARIEAARVGDAGRGFSLVAEQMSKLTDSVREIAKTMEQVTSTVRSSSARIDSCMQRLK